MTELSTRADLLGGGRGAGRQPHAEGLVHRKQFVLAHEPVPLREDYHVERLASGYYLSRCPYLRTTRALSRDGVDVVLLGDAVSTTQEATPLAEQIVNTASQDVDSLLWDWAGRWALIWGEKVYTDAAGLLGLHYVLDPEAGVMLTSSPGYLRKLLHCPPNKAFSPALKSPVMPESGFAKARKLLPSQVLDLRLGTVCLHGGKDYQDFQGDNPNETIDTIPELIGTSMRALVSVGHDVSIGLSGGWDSRLLLAVAVTAQIPFRCHTFVKYNSLLLPRKHNRRATHSFGRACDRKIPPRLASLVGAPHKAVRAQGFSAPAYHAYRMHTGGVFTDNEEYYASHGFANGVADHVILKGYMLELASGKRTRNFPVFSGDLDAYGDALLRVVHVESPGAVAAVRAWIDSLRARSVRWAEFDLRDFVYIEQAMGGWLSNVYQGVDFSYDSIPICNSRRLISLLVNLPAEMRSDHYVHERIIQESFPTLAEVPCNPAPTKKERLHEIVYNAQLKGMGHLVRSLKNRMVSRIPDKG